MGSDSQYKGADPKLETLRRKGHELEFLFIPTGGLNESQQLTVKFYAFLNQFEDQYAAEWTPDKVYGRMDPIATYQGTTRTISLGWAVPAYSNEEAKDNLLKMSKLISMCYPVYGAQESSVRSAGQISGAPLIKLKFANLIRGMSNSDGANNGLLGWIDGIVFKPNLDAGFYDPGANELYPKQIDLSCQFHALHEHALGWEKNTKDGAGSIGIPRDRNNFPYGQRVRAGGTYPKEIPADTKAQTDDAAVAEATASGANRTLVTGQFGGDAGRVVDASGTGQTQSVVEDPVSSSAAADTNETLGSEGGNG